ncbi:MAG: SMP-30/gluconolactonase/LRE family protein [Puniceicoccales bacterium]|jgi:sugar lactone lactonase YvrE|nr:SMP-30/gluconolactonase/LRE family protein [Puniceicoccales bacterium]
MNPSAMPALKPAVFVPGRCLLGEGPVWDYPRHRLLWVDILRGQLWCADSTGARVIWTGNTHLGAVAVQPDGALLAATQEGIGFINNTTGKWDKLPGSPVPAKGERFNDGKLDPFGRFWAGTLTYDLTSGAASLYRMDSSGKFTRVVSGATISNGLAWDVPRRRMYYIDTMTQKIDCFDYDIATGDISSRRTVVKVPSSMGNPDGMCLAPDGTLYVALWDGWTVANFDPDGGHLIQSIPVPAARPTSCCFGGDDNHTLFITTACDGLSEQALSAQPLAGSVFSVQLPG